MQLHWCICAKTRAQQRIKHVIVAEHSFLCIEENFIENCISDILQIIDSYFALVRKISILILSFLRARLSIYEELIHLQM